MELGYRPKDLLEALYLRKRHGARPLAGGTDLMVRYRDRAGALPDFPWPILFMNQLEELIGVDQHDDEFLIRASTTYRQILESPVPELLKEAIREIAAPALRNLGTLTGNVCNASPAGDAVCALYALDASVEIRSLTNVRRVPIEEFIQGPGKIDLGADELVTGVIVPRPIESGQIYGTFRKVGTRKANALSKVVFCGQMRVSEGTVLNSISLAIGAVAPVIVRSRTLERSLTGAHIPLEKRLVDQVVEGFGPLVRPIDDQRSTAEYRKEVALNLLRSFLSSHEECPDERA